MSWLTKLSQIQFDIPFYRVVCKQCYGNNNGDPLGEGSYWTPRWDGILHMLRTIMFFYSKNRSQGLNSTPWQVQVYKLDKSIMKDPPQDHEWAFNLSSDKDEQILVKALSSPVLVHDFNTEDDEFLNLISQPLEREIDYSKCKSVMLNGRKTYVFPNYGTHKIELAIETRKHHYEIVNTIDNIEALDSFCLQVNCDPLDDDGMLTYFISDMGWDKQ